MFLVAVKKKMTVTITWLTSGFSCALQNVIQVNFTSLDSTHFLVYHRVRFGETYWHGRSTVFANGSRLLWQISCQPIFGTHGCYKSGMACRCQKRSIDIFGLRHSRYDIWTTQNGYLVCVCVCVCVRERERECVHACVYGVCVSECVW